MRMPQTEDPNEHPARRAARLSRTYFAQRKKWEWLGLWAEHGEIRDPLGKSFMDPEGTGFNTPEAREKWWDDNCHLQFYYSMLASFVAGDQVANYEALIVLGDVDGVMGSFKCEGIWTYKVDEAGKLLQMYGYWEEEWMKETHTPLPEHHFYVE